MIPTRVLIALLAAATLFVAAPPALANDNNSGTVKVHDDETENPESRNVPHVSCDFWIEAFNLNDDSGTLVFLSWPPTGNKTEVTPTGASLEWESDATDEQGDHHFVAGPFQLPPGHYRVEVYTDDGHPGGNGSHFAKAKTFWVEPCETVFENPPCPVVVSVEARATEGGNQIALDWEGVADADAYVVYRAVEGGDFDVLAVVTGETAYVDASTTAGVTYEYYVTAVVDDVESVGCEIVSATAIPEFPTLAVGAVALCGCVAAYAALRRRS